MDLNDAQQRVVRAACDTSLKVVAGAGTGKTTTLVNRYCELVRRDGIPPERILALTFTRKAASEMRERIFKAVAKLEQPHLYRSLYSASITNFHSFCHRCIWQDPTRFGVHPEFDVATEVEIARLHRSIFRDFTARRIDGIAAEEIDPDLTPGKLSTFLSNCFGIIDKCRGLTMRPDDLLMKMREGDEDAYRHRIQIIVALWREYERRLGRARLLDFTGLIDVMVRTLENDPPLLAEYAGRFDYILVDEFQDTSSAQNRLLRLLSGGGFDRVTVVGDEKQSIYRWRDARPDNLREFGGDSEPLLVNYRSRQEILDLATAFMVYGAGNSTPVRQLRAERGAGVGAITLFHPEEGSDAGKLMEARAVANWISRVAAGDHIAGAGPVAFDKIAVLLRSLKPSSNLAAIESELQRLGIPFTVIGATASVERRVLLSVKHLLTVMTCSGEAESVEPLLYLLEEEPFSFPDRELMQLFRAARSTLKGRGVAREERDRSMTAALLLSPEVVSAVGDGELQRRLQELRMLLAELEARAAELDFRDFLSVVMLKAGVYLRLFGAGAGAAAVEHTLETIYGIVDQLMHKNEAAVSTFIEHLDALTTEDRRSAGSEPILPAGRVPVMTVHQAKGLEFDAVAVPGLRGKQFRGPSFFVEMNEGLFWNKHAGREIKDSADALRFKDEMKLEERCLIYVAMTRARDFLFLSSSEPGDERRTNRSSFFPEILECLEAESVPYEEWREPPPVEREPARPDRPPAASVPDGRDLAAHWRAGEARLSADRALDPAPGNAVLATTWRTLRSFAACPLRYRFTCVTGAKGDPDLEEFALEPEERAARVLRPMASPVPGLDPRTYGSVMHHLLDAAMSGDPHLPDGIASFVRAEAGRIAVPAGSVDALVERTVPLVKAVVEERAGSSVTVMHREQPFYLRIGRLLCTGIIDRIDRDGGVWRIVDYKTGEGTEEYQFQVQYYAWAWSRIVSADSVEGCLWYVRDGGGVEPVDTGPDVLADMENVAAALNRAVEENRFEATPGSVCTSCEYAGSCPQARL